MKLAWLAILFLCAAAAPKVAVFPLGGKSDADLRDRVGFSIRAKLDRDGTYEPIDGPTMSDFAAAANAPITYDTAADAVVHYAQGSDAAVIVWGDLSPGAGGDVLQLRTLDLRSTPPGVKSYKAAIGDAQQVRFVVEKFLQTLPGMAEFTHPDEMAVHHDAASDAAFARNPNLVPDADFSAGRWTALYRSEKYELRTLDDPPAVDHVAFHRQNGKNAVAMNLSLGAAQNNGLAAMSDAFGIEPGVRYRLVFRYRSTGPSQQSFVKGYADGKSLSGRPEDVEVYRLQVPPTGPTGGAWTTVEADLDPFNPTSPVQRLRVEFYAHLNPGTIEFDRPVLKAVGANEWDRRRRRLGRGL